MINRRNEVIQTVQQIVSGLGHMADSLEELDTSGLYVYADMIERNVQALASAANELNTYATGRQELESAVERARGTR